MVGLWGNSWWLATLWGRRTAPVGYNMRVVRIICIMVRRLTLSACCPSMRVENTALGCWRLNSAWCRHWVRGMVIMRGLSTCAIVVRGTKSTSNILPTTHLSILRRGLRVPRGSFTPSIIKSTLAPRRMGACLGLSIFALCRVLMRITRCVLSWVRRISKCTRSRR